MAIEERYYHRYLAAKMVFEEEKQAKRRAYDALFDENDELMYNYHKGYADGLDKAFEICRDMFSKELEKHEQELELEKEKTAEAVNRYRYRFWKN